MVPWQPLQPSSALSFPRAPLPHDHACPIHAPTHLQALLLLGLPLGLPQHLLLLVEKCLLLCNLPLLGFFALGNLSTAVSRRVPLLLDLPNYPPMGIPFGIQGLAWLGSVSTYWFMCTTPCPPFPPIHT